MIELLMLHPPEGVVEDTGDVTFLLDPDAGVDLMNNPLSITKTGLTPDETVMIGGFPASKLSSSTSGITVTFTNVFNFNSGVKGEWTIEWDEKYALAISSWAPDLIVARANNSADGIQTYWGDSGYGSQLIFQPVPRPAYPDQNLYLWRPEGTTTQLANTICRYAMVFKGGQVTIFRNGVPRKVSNQSTGAPNMITASSYPLGVTYENMKTIKLGYSSSVSHIGRVRISNFARYTKAYTPAPLTL